VELQIERFGFMKTRLQSFMAEAARIHEEIVSSNSVAERGFDILDVEAIGQVTYQQFLLLGDSVKGNRALSRRVATVYGRLYYFFLSLFGIHFSDHGLLKPSIMDSMLPSHMGVRTLIHV
jgi:hypothetical protein